MKSKNGNINLNYFLFEKFYNIQYKKLHLFLKKYKIM